MRDLVNFLKELGYEKIAYDFTIFGYPEGVITAKKKFSNHINKADLFLERSDVSITFNDALIMDQKDLDEIVEDFKIMKEDERKIRNYIDYYEIDWEDFDFKNPPIPVISKKTQYENKLYGNKNVSKVE